MKILKLAAALLLVGSIARAEDASAELTPEQRAELEKAFAVEAAKGPPPTPAPALASTGGFSFQSFNPDLAVIADFAAAGFSYSDPTAAGAPLQGGGHDPTKNGFNLLGVELALGASVDPYLRFDSNLVLSNDGIEIEEAYGTTLSLPYRLQARAGKFLTRFGRINNTHPHSWVFTDQPFMNTRVFGSEGDRGVGAELSELLPLPWYVELVGSVNDASGAGTARSFFFDKELEVRGLADLQYTFALKQFFPLTDDLSLAWGLSGAFGPNFSAEGAHSELYGTDLYLKYRPLTGTGFTIVALQVEWFFRRRQVPGDLLQDTGGYAYLFWRFSQRWGAAVRYEYGSPAYGQAGKADDYLDPEVTSSRQRVSANVSFWPSEFSRLRLQGSVDRPQWLQQPRYAAFLAVEFAVGAHGAHAF